ncbi:ABC transporter permease [Virgibacillus sp. NKC19-3]|uniref:ABC transporter permease n=1 Tax=Virgibacillus saliphilus TaxID=2831674 RepID=UPI001C9A56A5|nr:ABC transporter permease [Virgibacillus sp. NKC19-3]MBY7142615.1 ABC transporter permease [Virgibacillus sp. NKC19-3]
MRQRLSAEGLKLRHSKIIFVIVILPILSFLIGSANFYMNQEVLEGGWFSLWSQVGLFYGEFFLPILIAICCAYICRLEHTNQNWNMVMAAPVSISSIYVSKFVMVSMFILFAQLVFVGLYWIAGTLLSLQGSLPVEIIGWTLRGWFASLSIIAFQLGLSLRFRSFATPIGISLCAVFFGLFTYSANVGVVFPFSLLTIGLSVLNQDSLVGVQHFLFWGMNILFILLFSTISIRQLKTNDIVSS